jgi:penicillin V acylase-like amidase (Ntn superfamily)
MLNEEQVKAVKAAAQKAADSIETGFQVGNWGKFHLSDAHSVREALLALNQAVFTILPPEELGKSDEKPAKKAKGD